ncbi:hypothetical protein PHLCEN_2v7094 [Hermanssonia centrifuga]|uniref:Uncharacterized protein n=1 Tax=Hermanssonia centrifuga TaxID=98765 RepID=A0A2R6NXI9_9APHY|nr:hypothetical protein PHLCEN_2v7094 [Hermanssonia centrifuga]
MAKVSLDSPPLTPPLAMISSFQLANQSTRKPKQFWQRMTFLALFALIAISIYVLLVGQPSLAPIDMHDADRSLKGLASQRLSRLTSEAYRLAALHSKRPKDTQNISSAAAPPVQLTTEQELAAVTSFLASLPQNVIPSSVDPSKPIDPELVLDFDTRSPQAAEEIRDLVHDAWSRYPVVLYSKMHSPVSRELKQILSDLNLLPPPVLIEVENRPDEEVLKSVLHRLTGEPELPLLLVGGQTLGTLQEIRYMNSKGDLARKMNEAGAVVDGAKKKKGRKH